MNRSEDIKDLAAALAKAQSAMTAVGKANQVTIKSDKGAYSYAYADLGAVLDMLRKPLSDNGLSLLQSPTVTERAVEVETMLLHVSGQWTSCTIAMAIASHDPKAIGSAITYGRRYGTCLVGAVTDEDDDGERAGKRTPETKRTPAQSPPMPPALRAVIAREAAPADDSEVYEHADAEFAAMQSASVNSALQQLRPPRDMTAAQLSDLERTTGDALEKLLGAPLHVAPAPRDGHERGPRPWAPETVRDAIRGMVDGTRLTTDEGSNKRGLMALLNLYASDSERHALTQYLFGKTHRAELTDRENEAVARWAKVKQDADGAWVPDGMAIREAAAIVAAQLKPGVGG